MKLYLVNRGWTPRAWLEELRRKASATHESHARTIAEYKDWAHALATVVESGQPEKVIMDMEYKL